MNRDTPYAWKSARWVVPNHPVIGVTWYEAVAYTRWLNIILSEAGLVPDDGLDIRLPTEAEWEKSARSTDGRSFPWGEPFDQAYANTRAQEDLYIRRTSAVGLFGESSTSPYGIYDLSGNVWEWCLNEWREIYQPNDPLRLDGEAARSSRGGSWYHGPDHSRSASRFWYRPGVADFGWGFRVCASPKVESSS